MTTQTNLCRALLIPREIALLLTAIVLICMLYWCGLQHGRSLSTSSQTWINKWHTLWHTYYATYERIGAHIQADLMLLYTRIHIIITLISVLCKYPCRIIIAHPLLFSPSTVCTFSSRQSVHLPSSLHSFFIVRILLSPCHTHLCAINLPTNELDPPTLSLLLSTAAAPYLCSIFLPLFLTQPFYCSIDRHVISHMNNASSETKIVALLLSLGWDLFCNSLTECDWADFYSAAPATLLKGIGIWM